MNSSQWSYSQPSFLHNSGSFCSPSSHSDTVNNYGGGSSQQLLPPCQTLQTLSSRANTEQPVSPPILPNSNFNPLISPNLQQAKERYYSKGQFNGICKEEPAGISNYMQTRESVPQSEENYVGHQPFSSTEFNHRSPGPFGVLPHELVKPRANCFERNEKFVIPVSKSTSTSFSNGPYSERDCSAYSAPTSVQSSGYSGDNASRSPVVNSNFSSPSDYYSSPKPNFGAYNGLQSPVPQSPSVAQNSYPSSPFPNVDHSSCVPTVPPCSPLNGGAYSTVNGVPTRSSSRKSQHSPNSNVVSSNAFYNTSLHRQQSKTSDYHPDYNVYPTEQKSYSNLYSSVHSGHTNNSRISTRTSSHGNSIPHEGRMQYGHVAPVPSATLPSPPYVHKNHTNDVSFGNHSSVSSQQQIQSRRFDNSTNSCFLGNKPIASVAPSTAAANCYIENDKQFKFPASNEIVEDKKALDLFNCHVESETERQDVANAMSILENDLNMLSETETASHRQLRSATRIKENKSNLSTNPESTVSNLIFPKSQGLKYISCEDLAQSSSFETNEILPRKVGRRGRKKRGSITRSHNAEFGDADAAIITAVYKRMTEVVDQYQVVPERIQRNIVENKDAYMPKKCPNCSYLLTGENYIIPQNESQATLLELYKQLGTTQICKKVDQHKKKETPYQGQFIKHICTADDSKLVKTRNEVLNSHKHLRNKKPEPKKDLKIKLKKNPFVTNGWYFLGGPYNPIDLCNEEENNIPLKLEDSEDDQPIAKLLSSHEIKKEHDSETESNHDIENSLNKPNNVIESLTKPSASEQTLFTPSNDLKASDSICSNLVKSENLHTGKKKSRCFKSEEEPLQSLAITETQSSSVTSLPLKSSVKNSLIQMENEVIYARTLRKRKTAAEKTTKENEPKPPVKPEVVDYNSEFENFDDSDSDPTWNVGKAVQMPKPEKTKPVSTPRKRKSRGGRKPSAPKRRKKTPPAVAASDQKKSQPTKAKTTLRKKKAPSKKDKKTLKSDEFLIAKSDINSETPFLWKVDRDSSMLQRFDVIEQNGVILYRGTFTYAAGNNISVNNYVTANVRIQSPNVVQYIGPNLTEAAAISLSEINLMKNTKKDNSSNEKFDSFRDDFTIFIQSLLSQDMDSSFLQEVEKYKDDYFLKPLAAIEGIIKGKKDKLMKYLVNEKIQNSAKNYPLVKLIDMDANKEICEVCGVNKCSTRLEFCGEPYNNRTLQPSIELLKSKNEFSVCDKCSVTASLHSRLHHTKYNLFTECHSKANKVREQNKNITHEDVLKLCLEDTAWIEKLFSEQKQLWKESNLGS